MLIVTSHNNVIKVIEDLLFWLMLPEPSVLLVRLIELGSLLRNFLIRFAVIYWADNTKEFGVIKAA